MFNTKTYAKLFWPVLIEQILMTSVGIVNTMMVSSVGVYAISAVSIVDSINFVIMNLFIAFSTGATVAIAQQKGANDNTGANESASQSLFACVLLSLISGILIIFFKDNVIEFLFGEAEVLVKSNAIVYLLYSGVSYPFLATFTISAGVLRASGNTKSPMRISLISNAVNITIGAFCIYFLNLGVTGAGIALLSSRIVSAGILLLNLYNPKSRICIKKIKPRFTKKVLYPVLRIGIPASLDGMIFNGGKLLISTLITSLGTASLGAHGISSSVASFVNIPGNSISIVAVTVVGQAVGSGVYGKDLKKTFRSLILFSMVLLGITSLIMYPAMPFFIDFYNPTSDVKALALDALNLVLIFLPLAWPFSFILNACLRSTGDSLYVTIISVLSMWLVRVCGAWVSEKYFGMGFLGVWLFWCMDWVTRGAMFLVRTKFSPYVNNSPALKE